MRPKIKGIDLFCGAGGVTHGFKMAGIPMVLGVDADPCLKDTFEKNNSTPFLCADIQKVTAKQIIECSLIGKRDRILLSSCAPCQPFSLQNNKARQEHDIRKDLGFETVRIISEFEEAGFSPFPPLAAGIPALGYSPPPSLPWQSLPSCHRAAAQ